MNLVVGATGMVGAEICRLLAAAGKPVKALVRGTSDPATVARLERLGAVVTTASSMPFAYRLDENTPQLTDYPDHKAVIYGTGDNPISWISFQDVARFAVASLDNPMAEDTTLELGGPESVTPSDVVMILERAGGRPFEVTHVRIDALQAQLAAATDPMQKSFIGLMLNYASARPIDMYATLGAFPPRLNTVGEHARSVMT